MEKATHLRCQNNRSWLTNLYKKIVFKAFSSIQTGQITLVDNNERSTFGDLSSAAKVTITVN
ncbi:MAG: SAM-dependent methyltransferase, partial [Pseudoalteromonas nigrifaciens]